MGCSQAHGFTEFSYSTEVGEKQSGQTRIYRHPKVANGELKSAPHEDHGTVHQAFRYAFKENKNKRCIGTRTKSTNEDGEVEFGRYEWKTYGEIKKIAKAFGSGIFDMCPTQTVNGDNFKFIGINSKNREEWAILDIASVLYNFTIVPFYDTLGDDTTTYILNQTEMETTMASQDLVPKLLELKKEGKAGNIKNIIQIEPLTPERRGEIAEVGLNAFDYDTILQMGEAHMRDYNPPALDDVYTFSYTSGTTGDPKGAMITHKNLMSCIAACIEVMQFTSEDVHLSYLPMPHIFEKVMFVMSIYSGASIGMYHGNVLKLREDLAELRPTVFPSVPRLYSRMYDVISTQFREATGVKKALIEKGLQAKLEHLELTGDPTHAMWDSLVFGKTKAVLGGRVRVCVTASAPIAVDTLNFLKVCFCAPIVEGYGQTECTGAATATSPYDPEAGHVGGPVVSLEIKLEDIPDMEYTSEDFVEGVYAPRGEVCFRGPSVIKGYFKLPDKTEEAIDKDGWLHSGDVGLIRPNGSLKIIDRKKNIFKLAQGEYVAPEKLENMFARIPVVAQIFVHGDSLEATLVAIVVPDEAQLQKFADQEGLEGDFGELCEQEKVKEHILSEISKAAKEEKLAGFEVPRNIFVEKNPFTPESDILTPTFKLKRNIAVNMYREQLDKLYGK